jgi:hypothetical protein
MPRVDPIVKPKLSDTRDTSRHIISTESFCGIPLADQTSSKPYLRIEYQGTSKKLNV